MKKRLARKVYRGVVREWERAGMALTALLHTGRWRGDTFRRAASRLGVGLVAWLGLAVGAQAYDVCLLEYASGESGTGEYAMAYGSVGGSSEPAWTAQMCEAEAVAGGYYSWLWIAAEDISAILDVPAPGAVCDSRAGQFAGISWEACQGYAGTFVWETVLASAITFPSAAVGVFSVDTSSVLGDMLTAGALVAALVVLWLAYRSTRRVLFARA